jgi:hypothetical protein
MNPFALISGFSLQTKLLLILSLCITSFISGWEVHGWKFSHDQAHSIASAKKTRENAVSKVDKIVDRVEQKDVETKIVYKTIRERIENENDNRICFADQHALSLWNDAIAGTNTHRSEPSAEVGENEALVATVEQVLINAADNFETCNRNADKHDALVDAINVYKGKMCVCAE